MFRSPAIIKSVGVCAALCVGSTSLAANENDPAKLAGRAEIVDKLYACMVIENAMARLECFDQEVAAMQQAEMNDDLLIADREQVREARRGLFGFSLPNIRLFAGRDKRNEPVEEVKEVEEPLATFGSTSLGKATFSLESGAVWVQTDNVPVNGNPKPGDLVRIERAALGSYKASIDGRRAIRVTRVR
jgi:hypothetical protein